MSSCKSYKVDGIPYELRLGMNVPVCPPTLKVAVQDLCHNYDFVILDLFHKMNFRDENTIMSRQIAHTRSDTSLPSGYWQSVVLAKVGSSNINCDSPFDHVRQRSEAVLS